MDYPTTSPPPFTLDLGTALSLALAFSLMPAARAAAGFALPSAVSNRYYWLFVWCTYDFLTHTVLEGSYLYHCFFSYVELSVLAVSSDYPHPASLGQHHRRPTGLADTSHFLGRSDRLYGAFYSSAPLARLWQEYAKADSRWGGADTTVIALELLTVFGAGPMALYVCYLISKVVGGGNDDAARAGRLDPGVKAERKAKGKNEAKLWFTATVLSTAELYGGFITFAPEWLSANSALATDDPVYLWLYLFFFNMIWVLVPAWILYEAYHELGRVFERAAAVGVEGAEGLEERKKKSHLA